MKKQNKKKGKTPHTVPNLCPRPAHLSQASHLLKFVNLPDEEIPIAPGDLGVCDVNHVLWKQESQERSEVESRVDL